MRSQPSGSSSGGTSSADLLERSLHALGHPLTLAAVLLLLLNDHALKRAFPSALTGKLSDFTGLFFAPFVLAAALGLATRGLARLRPERSSRGARPPMAIHALSGTRLENRPSGAQPPLTALPFLATACLFALLKLDPPSNLAMNRALQSALGQPVWLVRDPSDLLALLALLPSWGLWTRAAGPRPPLRRSLAVLGLASLAAAATAPCLPDQPITHLIEHEGRLYALATAWDPFSNAYVEADQGRAWDYLTAENVPEGVAAAALDPVPLPKTACVPGMEDICYRATGQERAEISRDGGQTWETAWQPTAARRSYMQRVASGHGQMLACGKDLDLRTTDVAVLGSGSDHVAVLALGNEGVLRGRFDQSDWERLAVGAAEPTHERGTTGELLPPLIIFGETVRALVAAGAVFLALVVLAARRTPRGLDSRQAVRVAGSTSLLVAAAHWIPFALWVPGWIPGYSAAFWLSLVASVAALVWGMGRLPRASRPPEAPAQPSS